MKTTPHYKGHRWTTEELKALMELWQRGDSVADISATLNTTQFATARMVVKLRRQGIPLTRRTKGHVAGRSNSPWSQAEVEYLIRRRHENGTAEEIGSQLGRTPNAVHAMIQKLRNEQVPVPMLGNGVRRLYDTNALKGIFANCEKSKVTEFPTETAA